MKALIVFFAVFVATGACNVLDVEKEGLHCLHGALEIAEKGVKHYPGHYEAFMNCVCESSKKVTELQIRVSHEDSMNLYELGKGEGRICDKIESGNSHMKEAKICKKMAEVLVEHADAVRDILRAEKEKALEEERAKEKALEEERLAREEEKRRIAEETRKEEERVAEERRKETSSKIGGLLAEDYKSRNGRYTANLRSNMDFPTPRKTEGPCHRKESELALLLDRYDAEEAIKLLLPVLRKYLGLLKGGSFKDELDREYLEAEKEASEFDCNIEEEHLRHHHRPLTSHVLSTAKLFNELVPADSFADEEAKSEAKSEAKNFEVGSEVKDYDN